MNNIFSVIISTYNRAHILKNAIGSVLAQSFPDYEIIVSDDASSDDTRNVVAGFKSEKIIYLHAESRRGLAATRNAALEKTRGKYIVLIDDDVVLGNDFLKVLKDVILTEAPDVLSLRLIDPDTGDSFVDILDGRKRVLNFFDFNYFRGGAHVISRNAFKKAGYYDDRFGVGAKYHAAEESDYFFRLKQAGCKILYYPQLLVYHVKETDPSASKVFNYSYGISAMLTKHILKDRKNFHFYLIIILWRLAISLIRTLQYDLFPASIAKKNRVYKYRYFFKGTVKGALDYLITK